MPTPRRNDLPRYHYTEEEMAAATDAWGCNCGPGALAMLLCLKPNQVRDAIPDFLAKQYTNATMMQAALRSLGVAFRQGPRHFSDYGLCRIQWGGPWCKPGPTTGHPVQVGRWGWRFSHWIGSMGDGEREDVSIFDVNGGWMTAQEWCEKIVPSLTQMYPNSDGRFYITHNLELAPGTLYAPPGFCRVCGCTDADCSGCIAKTGSPCHWVDDEHTLCSACQ